MFGANGLVGYKDVPQMNGDAILVIKDGSGVGTVSYAQGKFSVIGTLNYLTVIGNNDCGICTLRCQCSTFNRTKLVWRYHISTSKIMVKRKYIVLHLLNKSVSQTCLTNWRANFLLSKNFLRHSINKNCICWGRCLYEHLP